MNTALTNSPAWTLSAWPALLWQVDKQIPWPLQHLGTQVTSQAAHCVLGQTFWGWHGQEGDLGLAWDWVQLQPGVVAMADPMAVLTNLRLVGDAGEVLTATESACRVNCVVHALPWQQEVQRALWAPAPAMAPALPGPGGRVDRRRAGHARRALHQ